MSITLKNDVNANLDSTAQASLAGLHPRAALKQGDLDYEGLCDSKASTTTVRALRGLHGYHKYLQCARNTLIQALELSGDAPAAPRSVT